MYEYRERINAKLPTMSPSYRTISQHLMANYTTAAMSTAAEIADACNLDTTAVVRCAQALGYAGWPDLRQQLKQHALDDYRIANGAGVQNYIDALHAWNHCEQERRKAALLPSRDDVAQKAVIAYRRARELTDYCLAQSQ